eukprot:6252007-Prymnesium_polylepis.1
MTVQSALPRAHPRPVDHGLATRPIHEIDRMGQSDADLTSDAHTPARPARSPMALLAQGGRKVRGV